MAARHDTSPLSPFQRELISRGTVLLVAIAILYWGWSIYGSAAYYDSLPKLPQAGNARKIPSGGNLVRYFAFALWAVGAVLATVALTPASVIHYFTDQIGHEPLKALGNEDD